MAKSRRLLSRSSFFSCAEEMEISSSKCENMNVAVEKEKHFSVFLVDGVALVFKSLRRDEISRRVRNVESLKLEIDDLVGLRLSDRNGDSSRKRSSRSCEHFPFQQRFFFHFWML